MLGTIHYMTDTCKNEDTIIVLLICTSTHNTKGTMKVLAEAPHVIHSKKTI